MSDQPPPSRESRESVFLSAVVTRFGQSAPARHRVRNLSPNGACIDHATALRKGETVLIDIGILEEVGATIAWTTATAAGLKFPYPIDISAAKSRPKPDHVQQGWNKQTSQPGAFVARPSLTIGTRG